MRYKEEEGQALLVVALAMSTFLFLGVGLAVDGSHIYAQRQMAQTAADAAAQAGIMSIFDGTNTAGTAGFSTGSSFTCTTADARTPCDYANKNGFGGSSSDTVTVSFPPDTAAPGVNFAADPVNLIQVTVQRSVSTTLMRLFGPTATTVKATAMAAIVSVVSPTPILVTHPSYPNTLSMNGTTTVKICGGPSRSIEVNSTSPTAYQGGGTVDLSQAGPADSGNCTTGTGADFAVAGGYTANPGSVQLGTTGHYLAKQSPMQDPLATVPAPSSSGLLVGKTTTIYQGKHGCTASTCVEYSPGLWTGGLNPGNNTVIFDPGLYYVNGGGVNFKQTVGGGANFNAMCADCSPDPNTGNGMVIYDTGPTNAQGFASTGAFNVGTQASLVLQGATLTTTIAQGQNGCTNTGGCTVPAPPYYGVLFWEDRNAVTHTGNNNHTFGQGNGCFTLIGTIYITNTRDIMLRDPTHYQEVLYNGTPCSTTVQQGDIIASTLILKGTVTVEMNLVPYGFLNVRQVAMVN